MIHNRKNTTEVVSSWRSFLSNKKVNSKRRLNESSAKDRNECFEAIISDLLSCDWDDDRVDTLVDVLQRCNPTDEELEMIAYGTPGGEGSFDLSRENFIEREPLESDEDLGM
tara:strand:+ start:502 stop:837 length:336 start_codon:yes stop_codon:yes gene_type:complete